VTNEEYLHASYFAAIAIGVLVAVASAAWLASGHREATHGPGVARLGKVVRRAFPPWLILAVLLGFASVTYFDCGHDTYGKIVADRAHLVSKTQEQAAAMARYLAVAIMGYGFVMVLMLWARARRTSGDKG
jgi:hypothetical protein